MPTKVPFSALHPAFAMYLGVTLSLSSNSTEAQPSQYSCRPNEAGDGWTCENNGQILSPNPTGNRGRYNSDAELFPSETQRADNSQDSGLEESSTPNLDLEVSGTQKRTQNETLRQTDSNIPQESGLDTLSQRRRFKARAYELDWVPRAELSNEPLQTLPDNCCGSYLDPICLLYTSDAADE